MLHRNLVQWAVVLMSLTALLLAPAAGATTATQDAPISTGAPDGAPPVAPGPPASRPGIYLKDDTSFWYGTADTNRYHLDLSLIHISEPTRPY